MNPDETNGAPSANRTEEKSKRYMRLVRQEDRSDYVEPETVCDPHVLDFHRKRVWHCIGEILAKHHFRHRQGRVYWRPRGCEAEEVEVTADWLARRGRRYALRKKLDVRNAPADWAAQVLAHWDVLASIRVDVIWGKEDDLPALRTIGFELARRGCYAWGGKLAMVVSYRKDNRTTLENISVDGLRTALSEYGIYIGTMSETEESKEARKEARKNKETEPEKEFEFVAEPVSTDRAKLICASATVRTALPPIRKLNRLRLPVRRQDGRIVLLPAGYDLESKTLTLEEFQFRTDMPFDEAKAFLRDVYSEFPYAHGDGTSLGIGYSVGLMGESILPPGTFFPGLAVMGNTVATGKTRFAKLAVLPLGMVAKTDMPPGAEEMSKTLHSSARGGESVLFFDNSMRRISGGPIEAAMTTYYHNRRVLAVSAMGTYEAAFKLVITGVDLRLDLGVARRFRVVRLHSTDENPELRVYKRDLNDHALPALREEYCAAIWAIIREWARAGAKEVTLDSKMPADYRKWFNFTGSVILHAGFDDLSHVNDSKANDERADVAELLKAMDDPKGRQLLAEDDSDAAAKGEWDTPSLVKLAIKRELFADALCNARTAKAEQTILGRILSRWVDRPVSGMTLRYRRIRSAIYRAEPSKIQQMAA